MRWLIRIGLIVSLVVLLASCSKEASEDLPTVSREAPDEIFSDFTTQESDSGKTKWQLMAPRASKYKAKSLLVLERPTIKFFNEQGKLETTLTAQNGELFEDSQNMLAYGDVVVVSEAGDVLETDSLLWNDARSKIISNSFVKLKRGSDIITGVGMECDYNLSSVNIKKNVNATIIDKEKKPHEKKE